MTPSYVERLKQILHLEQTQGFQDRAVLGGLAGLLENWRTLTKPGDEAVPAGRLHSISEVLQGYRSMTATERCRVVEQALVLLDHPAHPGGPPPGALALRVAARRPRGNYWMRRPGWLIQ
jgi:hypothetical protein